MKISAVVISLNEERNIERAVKSVLWADEIIVIDSHSEDRTREIAQTLGARVIERDWPGFSAQKQFGAEAAANDWILSLDADEWVSSDLQEEIATVNSDNDRIGAYSMPRLTTYLGREIRHSGWFPDRQVRLFNRNKCRWNGRLIHESVTVNQGSDIAKLSGFILHETVTTANEHARMIATRYAPLSARQMFADGKHTSRSKAILAAAVKFIQTYFIRQGFADGFPGFCIAYFAAQNAFLKHLMLLDLHEGRSPGPEN